MADDVEGGDMFEEVDHARGKLKHGNELGFVSVANSLTLVSVLFVISTLSGLFVVFAVFAVFAVLVLILLFVLPDFVVLSLLLILLRALEVSKVVREPRTTVRAQCHSPIPPDNDDDMLEEDAVHLGTEGAINLAEREAGRQIGMVHDA